jgi:uncharacterized protein with HEPN domain
MNEQDNIRLSHMLDAAREVIQFAEGRSKTDLKRDRMFALAVVKDIEIIGEAASRISAEAQERIHRFPGWILCGIPLRLTCRRWSRNGRRYFLP